MAAMLEVISFFVIAVGLIEATATCGTVEATQVETSDGWTKFTHKQPWLVKIEASSKNSKKESIIKKMPRSGYHRKVGDNSCYLCRKSREVKT